MSDAPRIILVAGIHRSGSTWVWGAARHLLTAEGIGLHAAWVEDYAANSAAPAHLVKAHNPKEVDFTPHIVLTTWRDRAASIASLIRMGWLKDTESDILASDARLTHLYQYWNARTDLETRYDDILASPAEAIARIAKVIGLPPDADRDNTIAETLKNQKTPKADRYDPDTLLHPGHRNPGKDQSDLINRINTLLAQQATKGS